MEYLKKIGIAFIYTATIILLSLLIITVLNYFDILGGKTVIILKILIAIVGFFIGGVIIGKRSIKKGWFEGLKYGLMISLVFILISLIISSFKFKALIFYAILLVSSAVGSMIGINRKKRT